MSASSLLCDTRLNIMSQTLIKNPWLHHLKVFKHTNTNHLHSHSHHHVSRIFSLYWDQDAPDVWLLIYFDTSRTPVCSTGPVIYWPGPGLMLSQSTLAAPLLIPQGCRRRIHNGDFNGQRMKRITTAQSSEVFPWEKEVRRIVGGSLDQPDRWTLRGGGPWGLIQERSQGDSAQRDISSRREESRKLTSSVVTYCLHVLIGKEFGR